MSAAAAVAPHALDGALAGADHEVAAVSPMRALIRSKGFVWLSNSHAQIFYWALAGRHFELSPNYAAWWAVIPRDEWPDSEAEVEVIQKDFGDPLFGDRRQELVFIGVNMDVPAITKLLDDCLLTPEEVAAYKKHWIGVSDEPSPEAAR